MDDDQRLRRSAVHVRVDKAEQALFRLVADEAAANVRSELEGGDFEGPYGRPAEELRRLGVSLVVASVFARAVDETRARLGYRELVTLALFDFEIAPEDRDEDLDQATLEMAEAACDAILARWKSGHEFLTALGNVSVIEPEPAKEESLTSNDLQVRYRELLGTERPDVEEK